MNEQLQKALVEILNKATNGVEAGVNFLSTEIPDVVHQLLLWKLSEAAFYILINLIIFIALVVVWVKYSGLGDKIDETKGNYQNRKITLTHDEDGDFSAHVMVTGGAALFIGLINIINISCYALDLVKIYLAPKIYLIEYASSLVK